MNVPRWPVIPTWILLVLALAVLTSGGFPPTAGVAHPDDAGPVGLEPMADLLRTELGDVHVLSLTPAGAAQARGGVLILAAPERGLYDGEARALSQWIARGGTLLVLTGSDTLNPFLAEFGVTVHGNLLLPTVTSGPVPTIRVQLPPSFGGGRLVLPNATTLVDAGEGVELVHPDTDLVLDVDGNRRIEVPPDRAGTFPVLALAKRGEGQLVVITSAAAGIGDALILNQQGLVSLLDALGTRGATFLDDGLHARSWADTLRGPAQAIGATMHLGIVATALLLVAGLAVVAATPMRPRPAAAGGRLDDPTPVTKEATTRAGP